MCPCRAYKKTRLQRHDVAVAVLVLQAFPVEGGAAGGTADEEAPRLHVARGPGQVAHALEAGDPAGAPARAQSWLSEVRSAIDANPKRGASA